MVGGPTFAAGFAGFFATLPLKFVVGKALMLSVMGPAALVAAAIGWSVGRRLWGRSSAQRERQLAEAFAQLLKVAATQRPLAVESGR